MADDNKLNWKQRRFLTLLGVPAFGIALAYTVATTYLPQIIRRFSGPALTGVLFGGEGIFALSGPILVGQYSDSLRTHIRGTSA